MPKMTSFIYCLDAQRIPASEGQGESINAIGVLSALSPAFVPGTFSFSIIFSILDVNILKDNSIQIIFKDNNNNILVDSGIIVIPPMPDDTVSLGLPKEYKGLNMSMDFRNVVFEAEGLYTTQIYFNGKLLEDNPVYVKGKR